ncbi:uncharacterized protein METZ01_LOCUS212084, partial [marine metagenome]
MGTLKSFNPATQEVIGEVQVTPHVGIPSIVNRARAAQSRWNALGLEGRAELLKKSEFIFKE